MKRTITLIGAVLMMFAAMQTYAQVPQAFNYQAVARNAAGNLLASQTIGLKLSIHQGSSSGTIVYSETFSPTTNQFGLFTVAIGTGTPVTGTFASITWSSGNYWLQVQMDPTGGTTYTNMGTDQLLTVPYAMYAAASGTSGATGPTGPAGVPGPTGPVGATGVGGTQTLAQTLVNGNSAGTTSIDMNTQNITNANYVGLESAGTSYFDLGNTNNNYIRMYYGNIEDYSGSHGIEGQVLTVHGTSPATYVTWDNPNQANGIGFSAYANTATAANGLITFDAESYDEGSAFASNTFTAPTTGLYHFDAAIRFLGVTTAGQYMWIAFYVNGSVTKDVTSQTSANEFGVNISGDLKLTAGDLVTVHDYCAQTLTSETGSFNTWFDGHRIH